ncbi:MAG: DegT/DnrJ/EryC1/StrS aminotransferase family protein [Rhodocyclaceae bacterium]|nr:DegT/DnrJ/EryC1/StrS aminotransferase family protein [Rhodocyclaceae bacterium]
MSTLASSSFLKFAGPVITDEMADAVRDSLLSGWLTSGPRVAAFEAALSDYHGGRPTRVFTSATAAMEVAFEVCGIGPGDEIITSAMTFFSVGNMIEKTGATTVFVDCDLTTRNIKLDQVERAITPHTKAIVPTHMSGLPCEMDRLYNMAQKHGLRVIEDAALAIGSSWQGKRIGAFGDIATFSFHPNKNMTTIEGGAAVFADEAEARRAEVLRFHGISRLADGTRDVTVAGGKFNMSDVSARLGLGQLAMLDTWNAHRRDLAHTYMTLLGPIADEFGIVLPASAYPNEPTGHSWNMYCVLLPFTKPWQSRLTRKQFIDAMHAQGIGIGISYEAMHLTSLFRSKGHRDGEHPNAERIARQTVTLPLHAAMTETDVARVVKALISFLAKA